MCVHRSGLLHPVKQSHEYRFLEIFTHYLHSNAINRNSFVYDLRADYLRPVTIHGEWGRCTNYIIYDRSYVGQSLDYVIFIGHYRGQPIQQKWQSDGVALRVAYNMHLYYNYIYYVGLLTTEVFHNSSGQLYVHSMVSTKHVPPCVL